MSIMDNTGGKDVQQPILFQIINEDLVENLAVPVKRNEVRKRSSILKQPRVPLQDVNSTANLSGDEKQKPAKPVRRVSFADTFQVLEFQTETKYDSSDTQEKTVSELSTPEELLQPVSIDDDECPMNLRHDSEHDVSLKKIQAHKNLLHKPILSNVIENLCVSYGKSQLESVAEDHLFQSKNATSKEIVNESNVSVRSSALGTLSQINNETLHLHGPEGSQLCIINLSTSEYSKPVSRTSNKSVPTFVMVPWQTNVSCKSEGQLLQTKSCLPQNSLTNLNELPMNVNLSTEDVSSNSEIENESFDIFDPYFLKSSSATSVQVENSLVHDSTNTQSCGNKLLNSQPLSNDTVANVDAVQLFIMNKERDEDFAVVSPAYLSGGQTEHLNETMDITSTVNMAYVDNSMNVQSKNEATKVFCIDMETTCRIDNEIQCKTAVSDVTNYDVKSMDETASINLVSGTENIGNVTINNVSKSVSEFMETTCCIDDKKCSEETVGNLTRFSHKDMDITAISVANKVIDEDKQHETIPEHSEEKTMDTKTKLVSLNMDLTCMPNNAEHSCLINSPLKDFIDITENSEDFGLKVTESSYEDVQTSDLVVSEDDVFIASKSESVSQEKKNRLSHDETRLSTIDMEETKNISNLFSVKKFYSDDSRLYGKIRCRRKSNANFVSTDDSENASPPKIPRSCGKNTFITSDTSTAKNEQSNTKTRYFDNDDVDITCASTGFDNITNSRIIHESSECGAMNDSLKIAYQDTGTNFTVRNEKNQTIPMFFNEEVTSMDVLRIGSNTFQETRDCNSPLKTNASTDSRVDFSTAEEQNMRKISIFNKDINPTCASKDFYNVEDSVRDAVPVRETNVGNIYLPEKPMTDFTTYFDEQVETTCEYPPPELFPTRTNNAESNCVVRSSTGVTHLPYQTAFPLSSSAVGENEIGLHVAEAVMVGNLQKAETQCFAECDMEMTCIPGPFQDEIEPSSQSPNCDNNQNMLVKTVQEMFDGRNRQHESENECLKSVSDVSPVREIEFTCCDKRVEYSVNFSSNNCHNSSSASLFGNDQTICDISPEIPIVEHVRKCTVQVSTSEESSGAAKGSCHLGASSRDNESLSLSSTPAISEKSLAHGSENQATCVSVSEVLYQSITTSFPNYASNPEETVTACKELVQNPELKNNSEDIVPIFSNASNMIEDSATKKGMSASSKKRLLNLRNKLEEKKQARDSKAKCLFPQHTSETGLQREANKIIAPRNSAEQPSNLIEYDIVTPVPKSSTNVGSANTLISSSKRSRTTPNIDILFKIKEKKKFNALADSLGSLRKPIFPAVSDSTLKIPKLILPTIDEIKGNVSVYLSGSTEKNKFSIDSSKAYRQNLPTHSALEINTKAAVNQNIAQSNNALAATCSSTIEFSESLQLLPRALIENSPFSTYELKENLFLEQNAASTNKMEKCVQLPEASHVPKSTILTKTCISKQNFDEQDKSLANESEEVHSEVIGTVKTVTNSSFTHAIQPSNEPEIAVNKKVKARPESCIEQIQCSLNSSTSSPNFMTNVENLDKSDLLSKTSLAASMHSQQKMPIKNSNLEKSGLPDCNCLEDSSVQQLVTPKQSDLDNMLLPIHVCTNKASPTLNSASTTDSSVCTHLQSLNMKDGPNVDKNSVLETAKCSSDELQVTASIRDNQTVVESRLTNSLKTSTSLNSNECALNLTCHNSSRQIISSHKQPSEMSFAYPDHTQESLTKQNLDLIKAVDITSHFPSEPTEECTHRNLPSQLRDFHDTSVDSSEDPCKGPLKIVSEVSKISTEVQIVPHTKVNNLSDHKMSPVNISSRSEVSVVAKNNDKHSEDQSVHGESLQLAGSPVITNSTLENEALEALDKNEFLKDVVSASHQKGVRWKIEEISDNRIIISFMWSTFFVNISFSDDECLRPYLKKVSSITCESKFDSTAQDISKFSHTLLYEALKISSVLQKFPDTSYLLQLIEEIYDVAKRAETLIIDVECISIRHKFFLEAKNRLAVEILSLTMCSKFLLSFPLGPDYPLRKIKPSVKVLTGKKISEEMIQTFLSKVQPGKRYLYNMVKAAETMRNSS